jgi:hypothetical protein
MVKSATIFINILFAALKFLKISVTLTGEFSEYTVEQRA